MEDEYLIPGDGFVNETAGEGQHLIPGGDFIDVEAGSPPPPTGDRRRPVILAMG